MTSGLSSDLVSVTAETRGQLNPVQIARQYLSLPVLPRDRAGAPSASSFAQAANDKFASIIAEAPDRFGSQALGRPL